MTIEIRNYNPDIATKSLLASFDVIFRNWGLIIHECKLFEKDGKKWIVFPNKPVKNGDGTWGKPLPYVSFVSPDLFYKLQEMVLKELEKIAPAPAPSVHQEFEFYPHGLAKNTTTTFQPTPDGVPF